MVFLALHSRWGSKPTLEEGQRFTLDRVSRSALARRHVRGAMCIAGSPCGTAVIDNVIQCGIGGSARGDGRVVVLHRAPVARGDVIDHLIPRDLEPVELNVPTGRLGDLVKCAINVVRD